MPADIREVLKFIGNEPKTWVEIKSHFESHPDKKLKWVNEDHQNIWDRYFQSPKFVRDRNVRRGNQTTSGWIVSHDGIEYLREEKSRESDEKLKISNYSLTLVLALAAAMNLWIVIDGHSPKLIGPGLTCAENLPTNITIGFGNYGGSEATLLYFWKGENIVGYTDYLGKANYSNLFNFSRLYMPIQYTNNQQESFQIIMLPENISENKASFKLEWQQVGDMFSFLFPKKFTCNYIQTDETRYHLVNQHLPK